MKILRLGHPALKTICSPVVEIDPLILDRLEIMWEAMSKADGVGLSANQVGFFNRMFVMLGEDGKRYDIINPNIVDLSAQNIDMEEGCLSIPGFSVKVKSRSWALRARFQDKEGKWVERHFTGRDALCFQHEMEHLDGKNFLDHVNRNTRRKIMRKFKA